MDNLNSFCKLWTDLNLLHDPKWHFDKIEKAYKNKSYHNLSHINYGLSKIEEMSRYHQTSGSKYDERYWNVIKLAFWLHDFSDKEELSAQWAKSIFLDFYKPSEDGTIYAKQISRLINATKHKYAALNFDEAIICDADLAILGDTSDKFDEYEYNVRKEYLQYSDTEYAEGRSKIIQNFLNRPWIYMTIYGREHWELMARHNLKISLNRWR